MSEQTPAAHYLVGEIARLKGENDRLRSRIHAVRLAAERMKHNSTDFVLKSFDEGVDCVVAEIDRVFAEGAKP